MQLSEMQTEVALVLDNLEAGDPFYKYVYPASGSEDTSWINKAALKLGRLIAPKIPELYKSSWTIGPTVDGTNYIAKPVDAVAIQEITSAHLATSPDWSITRTYPLTYVDPADFDLLTKDSTIADWPKIYTEIGKKIYVWPTPSADFIDYLHAFGVLQETVLVNASDTLFMEEFWHDFVVQLAIAIGAKAMGRPDAQDRYNSLIAEIRDTADPSGLKSLGRSENITVLGAPTRESVYGG